MKLNPLFDMHGRRALITGGSRGIGYQIAMACGLAGAEVMLSARHAEEIAQAVGTLEAAGVKASGFVGDLASEAQVLALAEEVRNRLGGCDVLVNNAGFVFVSPTVDYPLAQWQRQFDINVTAPFLLCRALGPGMIENRYGRILNIASPAGFKASGRSFAKAIGYNSSKAATINFTRALAAEWGEHGITVNAIAPGIFPTRMNAKSIERMRAHQAATAPIPHIAEEEDIRGAALLFCSDAGRHITGQLLTVDGGLTIV